ncbi:DNA-binding response regulator [Marinobacter nanhaiticus D15-8W]|uniref:DNA-binding response regulator n=2 Tax=Marinobacter TaxID=2742 RepID=N6VUU5_9GAMM|nr:DNA-binding response regulator [Marinobacter nanhaiticus D15-8W]
MVADDHPLIREGIAAVIESQADIALVGEANNGREAVEGFLQHQPDVILMDLQMPEMNGIDAIRAIHQGAPSARIAVLTTYRGDVRALHAIQAGAVGYLLKSSLRRELVDAIRALAAGKRWFPPEIAAELAEHLGVENLSLREVEVLQLISLGHANKVIAKRLAITEDTVKGHVKSVIAKLGANNRTHAVAIGLKRGIIDSSLVG